MKLNQDQQNACNSINNFLRSKNKFFNLKGPAGSGKTTVISEMFKNPVHSHKKIILSATTNKAVSVIDQMVSDKFGDIYENIDFHTIHKICNIKRKIDHDGIETFNFDEKPNYNKKAKTIYNYDIIVIDESSMITLEMLKHLHAIKRRMRGKVIFVGDNYQLPPVNENESMVFDFDYFDDSFTLTKIERFNSNILKFSIRIRDSIDNKAPISIKNISDDTFKLFKNDSKAWMDDYLSDFSYENTFLAYTNKRCDYINNYIRKKYFKNENLPEYIQGELIVFNNYYNTQDLNESSHTQGESDMNASKFYTSNGGKILDCKTQSYTIPGFPLDSLINLNQKMTVNFKLKKKKRSASKLSENQSDNKEPELCPICFDEIKNVDNILETDCKHVYCEDCIRMWLVDNKTCPFCRMTIVEDKIIINNDPKLTEKLNALVELTSNKSFEIWNLLVQSKECTGDVYIIKKEEKQRFEAHKENIKRCVVDIKNYIYRNVKKSDNRFILKRFWEYYYLNYIDYFADISYGYCITVHKSQGSTFNKVYIDAKNILEYNRKGYINYKCLYTAITRASEKVLMFI